MKFNSQKNLKHLGGHSLITLTWVNRSLWISRVLKYPKKWQHFSCLLDEEIPKISKKLNSHIGFLSYLQNSTAHSAHSVAHFCPALVCPEKATVRIQFLLYFWNPLIKYLDMKNVVKSSKHFLGYFNTLETHSEGLLTTA